MARTRINIVQKKVSPSTINKKSKFSQGRKMRKLIMWIFTLIASAFWLVAIVQLSSAIYNYNWEAILASLVYIVWAYTITICGSFVFKWIWEENLNESK